MMPYAGLTPSLRTPTRTASSGKAYAPPYAGLTRTYAYKVLGPALHGAYAQLKRNIFDDKVTLTGSLRYDKQTVLEEGNITPRLGLLVNLSENQNIRFSAQQGFRNPTNQDKFQPPSQAFQ